MAMHTMLINKPPDAGTEPAHASPQHHLAAWKRITLVFRNESMESKRIIPSFITWQTRML